MNYKLLESNGVEIENVDGAAFNNFCAGCKNGIIAGVLNECGVYLINSTSLEISTGELLIQGFRVKILSPYSISTAASASTITYQVVARITLSLDRTVVFEIESRVVGSLVQDNIFETESGIYEVEIARFSTDPSGLSSVTQTLEVLSTPVDLNTLNRLSTVENSLNELVNSVSSALTTLYKINRGGLE